jgi:hypothetical protein
MQCQIISTLLYIKITVLEHLTESESLSVISECATGDILLICNIAARLASLKLISGLEALGHDLGVIYETLL